MYAVPGVKQSGTQRRSYGLYYTIFTHARQAFAAPRGIAERDKITFFFRRFKV